MPDLALNPLDPQGVSAGVALPGSSPWADPAVLVAAGFGAGPFGERDWVHEVMWATLTTGQMRADDELAGASVFRRWQYALGHALNRFRRAARSVWGVHSAWETRTPANGVDVSVVGKEAGATLGEVTLFDDALLYAPSPLAAVRPGWSFVDGAGKAWVVLRVRSSYPLNTARADGTVFGLLYEFDIAAADVATVSLGVGEAFVPPDLLHHLAEHYGIAFVQGMLDGVTRALVGRHEWVDRRKGTAAGIGGFGRARGFSFTPTKLHVASSGLVAKINATFGGPATLFTGVVPWRGFPVAYGDGVANAVDSESPATTLLGVLDTSKVYLEGRPLGEGLGVVCTNLAPSSDGATGTTIVTYTITLADGTNRTFRARDVRISSSYGELRPLDRTFAEAFPTAVVGRVEYTGSNSKIVVLGVDQSVTSGVTYRPFAQFSGIFVDFDSQRSFTSWAPQIARFDEVKGDVIALDTYLWENAAAYEFSLVVETVTPAALPHTATSMHTLRVRYTYGAGEHASPIPPSPSAVPLGNWKLTDGTNEWWVERCTSVVVDKDDLVVAGTLPPVTGINKLTLVPREVPSATYAAARVLRVVSSPLGGVYTNPSGGHSNEADVLFVQAADVLPAHVTVLKEKQ